MFIGRADAKAEAPLLWPPDVKSQLTGKDSDTGKVWKEEEEGATKDEMVGWHHQQMAMSSSTLWKIEKDREAWGAVVHEAANSWTGLNDWTTTTTYIRHLLHAMYKTEKNAVAYVQWRKNLCHMKI